jgi:effector-binding domain-containing protein
VTYAVSVQHVEPRALAAVRERMAVRDVPSRFREFLDQVYAAARSGSIAVDGQNVFVYRRVSDGTADIDFGVGARATFDPVGRVEYVLTPEGDAVTTTHWGDYAQLGAAYRALFDWCAAEKRTLAGVSWEVYGHWDDDPAKRRTDIFELLRA